MIPTDRNLVGLVKMVVLCGAAGLPAEGLFEIKLLATHFLAPLSIPRQSTIIEHFVAQQIAFPITGLLLVFAPVQLNRLFVSKLAAGLLATLAILVTLPEFIVSSVDLFRPYPFPLQSPILNRIQMLNFGTVQLNFLQVQDVPFAHLSLLGMIVALGIRGAPLLARFAGPRTGGA
jgi:hypothetical protein